MSDQMISCGACGLGNPAGAESCALCNAPLPAAMEEAALPLEAAPPTLENAPEAVASLAESAPAPITYEESRTIKDARSIVNSFVEVTDAAARREEEARKRFEDGGTLAKAAYTGAKQQADEQMGAINEDLHAVRTRLVGGITEHFLGSVQSESKPADVGNADPGAELRACRERANNLGWGFINDLNDRSGAVSWFIRIILGAALLGFLIAGLVSLASGSLTLAFLELCIGFLAALLLVAKFRYHMEKLKRAYSALADTAAHGRYWYQKVGEVATERHNREIAEATARRDGELRASAATEREAIAELQRTALELIERTGYETASWHDDIWQTWQPPNTVGGVASLGTLQTGAHGQTLDLPALFPCPDGSNLLIAASGDAKRVAMDAVQALVLRLLVTVPPGKIKLVLIDPVGLGQNVAPLMHLTDYDESLVTSRAWTEPQHIEQRLTDLSEHMENVIQKYLRNEYASIEEYNAKAGEVAEPYRILVVMNFPVGFTDTAARRLVSIASNGPRCGVYTFTTLDLEQQVPYGFTPGDLRRVSSLVEWDGERFIWHDEDFKQCSLTLDSPPAPERSRDLLRLVGEAAVEQSHVEVPFERIAADLATSWRESSTREGLSIPIGRSGATRNQFFKLGDGTSQHVLVAGKTGSGKSTLLHILVTNLALTYNPNELELYLIDFKKGVEFKSYATHNLPHARVIAIESEREFGLSALQGLDAELKRRGDLFRDAGTQNLEEYREKHPDARCPRILLIVDEFQEFFTEDDAVAREATLVLDRVVRQGRAFGIHVLLGSQTLAGAYTLARSTIDQMAVRIALQCSEADARLILSDDNAAARLLSRPGEAVYNAANGMIEGNSIFQIVWLDDEGRDRHLEAINALAQEQRYASSNRPVVFEGNAPADIAANEPLATLLTVEDRSETPRAAAAWVGEPIALRKEPTHAVFRNQSGSNLLIAGQNEEAALGMMTAALTSLTAQYPRRAGSGGGDGPGASFYVLDFTPADSAHAGTWKRLAEALPYPILVAGRRDLPQIIGEIEAEVTRRLTDDQTPGSPIYLFVHGLQRARDLRQEEESFGYSFASEEPKPPSPAKQFPTILREGPDLAIHTLAWCDTMPNLNRTISRQLLREFDLRIVFQMGTEDSSMLIDSPAASKLGLHRAFLFSEEAGTLEKFRPYGPPSDAWLDALRELVAGQRQEAPV